MTVGNKWSGYQLSDVSRDLSEGTPTCPMVLLSCSTGNFASAGRCLTEFLLLAPGGPVAVAGATTESHGLTNALHGLAMGRTFAAEPERLGDMWLGGLRASRTERHMVLEMVLPNTEGSLEPEIDVAQLRRDQVWMYALLGDPATRIRVPHKLNAAIERTASGWRWAPSGPRTQPSCKLGSVLRASRRQGSPDSTPMTLALCRRRPTRPSTTSAKMKFSNSVPWTEEVSRPGEVRLVAFAPDRWYVAVLKAE